MPRKYIKVKDRPKQIGGKTGVNPGEKGVKEEKIKLTPKQERFCQTYLIDFNASRAARDAGYSKKTDFIIGWKLLREDNIQRRLDQLRAKMGESFNITRERIAQEYARIGFLDMRKIYDEKGNLIPIHKLGDDEAAAISEVEVNNSTEIDDDGNLVFNITKKIKRSDKKGALDSLAKLMGYNAPDKIAPVTPDGKPINFVPPVINITIVPPPKDDLD